MTTKQDKTSRFVMCLILPPSSEQIPSPTICPCSYFTLVMWNPVGLAPISTNVTELQGKSHGVLADAFKTWRGTEKTQNTAGGRGSEQKHRPAFPLKTLLQLTLLDMGIVEFSSSPLNNMQIESRKMDLGGVVLLKKRRDRWILQHKLCKSTFLLDAALMPDFSSTWLPVMTRTYRGGPPLEPDKETRTCRPTARKCRTSSRLMHTHLLPETVAGYVRWSRRCNRAAGKQH